MLRSLKSIRQAIRCGFLIPLVLSPMIAGSVSSLTGTGSQGDFATVIQPSGYQNFYLDTGTGWIYGANYNPGGNFLNSGWQHQFAMSTVIQSDGSAVAVLDFSNFDLPSGDSLTLFGGHPAAILSQNDVTIAGSVQLWNGGVGGYNNHQSLTSNPYGDATGSGGGSVGGYGSGYAGYCGWASYGTGGGGGGGGNVVAGGAGDPGAALPACYEYANFPGSQAPGGAGGAAISPSILAGGGGGGGTQAWAYSSPEEHGYGGDGGGAVFFGTPGDLTIASTGSINANGLPGSYGYAGPGGGGAGGDIWFSVSGTWTNDGAITATGGAGAAGPYSTWWGDYTYAGGAGAGGYVDVTASQIVGKGTIDVSSAGGSAYNGIAGFNIEGGEVPEPATVWFLLAPLAGLAVSAMRRARHI